MALITIQLEKNDAEFLENLMATGIEKASRFEGGWHNHIERLLAIQKALEGSVQEKQTRTRRTKEEKHAEEVLALCKKHPTNKFLRRPSTDCKECWEAYKKLEPMKYEAAWRSFKATQRKKAEG